MINLCEVSYNGRNRITNIEGEGFLVGLWVIGLSALKNSVRSLFFWGGLSTSGQNIGTDLLWRNSAANLIVLNVFERSTLDEYKLEYLLGTCIHSVVGLRLNRWIRSTDDFCFMCVLNSYIPGWHEKQFSVWSGNIV